MRLNFYLIQIHLNGPVVYRKPPPKGRCLQTLAFITNIWRQSKSRVASTAFWCVGQRHCL